MPRHREFEPEGALERSVNLFWQKGFFDSSMDDLVHQTGVSRRGLYSVFGNKRGLFIASLNHYQQTIGKQLFMPLLIEDAGLDSLHQFLKTIAQLSNSDESRFGCFVCNTAIELAPQDPEIQRNVLNYFNWMYNVFAKALQRAIEQGDLPIEFDIEHYAQFLVGTFEGVVVMARAGANFTFINAFLKTAAAGLGLSWEDFSSP
ncbi:MAG: TetR/AcrR family transcriptional regulator [Leptolyngbya sp. SIO1D8]|nr:TetR/AcrR family transcriptional regulator [Leptolyngbya sp. SIO1D8]